MTEQASDDRDNDLPRLYNLPTYVLTEYEDAALLPTFNTGICQFRQALDRHPAPHTIRSESLAEPAVALVTKFSPTKQLEDCDQTMLARSQVLPSRNDVFGGTRGRYRPDVRVRSQSDSRICVNNIHRKIFPLGVKKCLLHARTLLKCPSRITWLESLAQISMSWLSSQIGTGNKIRQRITKRP